MHNYRMRNSWFLLFGTPQKPLTEEQARLKRVGEEYFLKLCSEVGAASAASYICDLLEPQLQGFIESHSVPLA